MKLRQEVSKEIEMVDSSDWAVSQTVGLGSLFVGFLKVGLFTIGGGYAMLPVAERVLTQEHRYFSMDDVLEAYTIAQTMPGVIAANTAAVLGYRKKGFSGALFSVLGVVFPSIVIISIIAAFYDRIKDINMLNKAFSGIRIGVIALLCRSAYRMATSTLNNWCFLPVFFLAFVLIFFRLMPSSYIVFFSALLGITVVVVLHFFQRYREGGVGTVEEADDVDRS